MTLGKLVNCIIVLSLFVIMLPAMVYAENAEEMKKSV